MGLFFDFLIFILVIYCCVQIYKKIMKTGEKVKKSISYHTTTVGRNRASLVEELYDFIQSHGGVSYVYVGLESCTVYDKKGRSFEYVYEKHGYGRISVYDNGVLVVAEHLAKKFKCHMEPYFQKVEDRGSLGQTISYATGNYGKSPGGGYIAGAYLLDDYQYNAWLEKVKNAKPPLKNV